MLSGPSLLIIEQHDRRAVPSGAVEPHVRWCLGLAPGFLQYLDRRLIRLDDVPFEKLPVQVVIDPSEITFRRLQRPVGQRLTRQAYPKTTELCKRQTEHTFTRHAPFCSCDGMCRLSQPAFRTPEASRPVVFASSFSPR